MAPEKGTVKFFDNIKGFGYLLLVDGREVFVPQQEIKMEGLRVLLDGWAVEVESVVKTDRGLQARAVRPVEMNGLAIATKRPEAVNLGGKNVELVINEQGLADALTVHKPLDPHYSANEFSAYYIGVGDDVKAFSLGLPKPSTDQVGLLLDPEKNPRRVSTERYEDIVPGSFVLLVNVGGGGVEEGEQEDAYILLQKVGKRYQSFNNIGGGESWLLLQERFSGHISFAPRTVEQIEAALREAGMKHNEKGLARAVLRAFEIVDHVRTGSASLPVKVLQLEYL